MTRYPEVIPVVCRSVDEEWGYRRSAAGRRILDTGPFGPAIHFSTNAVFCPLSRSKRLAMAEAELLSAVPGPQSSCPNRRQVRWLDGRGDI
jgi:hypothetical protein